MQSSTPNLKESTVILMHAMRIYRIARRLATDCHRDEIASMVRNARKQLGSANSRLCALAVGAKAAQLLDSGGESEARMQLVLSFGIAEGLERSYRRCKPVSVSVLLGEVA